jgi:photosystem II stability/assembly factor-like uncharacterized protein
MMLSGFISARIELFLLVMVASLLPIFLGPLRSCAYAEDQPMALSEQAIPVKDPRGVLLISIARAGDRLVAVGEHGVIVYSDDNGKNWVQAIVPVSVTMTSVAFATSEEGWAAGDCGVVLHTHDGGATWQLQITGIRVNQMVMAAAAKFYAADPTNVAAQTALRRANIFMQDGPDKPFFSILPSNIKNVMIFGAYRMCIRSADGGKSWDDCSLDVADPISHNLYDAIQEGSSIYIAGEVGMVFHSSDDGNTFPQVASPADDTLFGILHTADNTLVTFGVAGHMFRSVDEGMTWSPVNIAAQANLTAGIILRSGTIIAVSEAGDVYASDDDGLTFHVSGGNQGMGLFDLVQAANGDIVFVGTGGVRVAPQAVLN